MNALNFGTWKTSVVTAKATRNVAKRQDGTAPNQPLPKLSSGGTLRGGLGTELRVKGLVGARAPNPLDGRDVGIPVMPIARDEGDEPRESIEHLGLRPVGGPHPHRLRRAVASHIPPDLRNRFRAATSPRPEESHLIAGPDRREHPPAIAGPAVVEVRGLELLQQGHEDLDRKPDDDERRCPAPAPPRSAGGE